MSDDELADLIGELDDPEERESNRKYMKKIREKSKKFAEHERIAEENNSDSKLCAEQNATSKSNRQKVKGEKIA